MLKYISIKILRAKNEIYSLNENQKLDRYDEESIENLALPNSMFINGIVIDSENLNQCQVTEGTMI